MSALSASSKSMPIAATLSLCAATKAEMSGSSFRHGEHHVAQKFTMTHFPVCAARSKLPPSRVFTLSAGFGAAANAGNDTASNNANRTFIGFSAFGYVCQTAAPAKCLRDLANLTDSITPRQTHAGNSDRVL